MDAASASRHRTTSPQYNCWDSTYKTVAKFSKCTHAQCWPAYLYAGVVVGTLVGVYVLNDSRVTTGVIGGGFITALALSCICNRPPPDEDEDHTDEEVAQINIQHDQNLQNIEEGRLRVVAEEKKVGEVVTEIQGSIAVGKKKVAEAQQKHLDTDRNLTQIDKSLERLRGIRDDSSHGSAESRHGADSGKNSWEDDFI